MLETQKTQKRKKKQEIGGITNTSKMVLDFPPELQIERLSPFLTPPSTHFQALATGKPALLQEISCH